MSENSSSKNIIIEKDEILELELVIKDWTSDPIGRRSFLASVPLLLTACASSERGSGRHREGDNTGQKTSITVNDEKKMTAEILPKMKKDYPAIKDHKLQNYISQLGHKITRANKLEGAPYQYNFSVVDVKYVNAFALPAGTVFITAPLLAMAGSEAELAGVIGHEIGHIKARHAAERIDAAKKQQKKSMWYAIGGGLLGGAAGFGLGKMLCRERDKKCLAKATALGAAAGAGGGMLIQKYAFMQNSQENEMEADRIGFRTSVAAGYSKDHVGRFYEKLLQMEKQAQKGNNILASFADAMSTHPPSESRVQQMREMAAQTPQGKGKVSTKTFDQMKRLCAQYAKG